jgi:hypothetical protein
MCLSLIIASVDPTVVKNDDDDNDDDDDKSSSSSLSGGAIAGIIIGSLAGVAILSFAIYYAVSKHTLVAASMRTSLLGNPARTSEPRFNTDIGQSI